MHYVRQKIDRHLNDNFNSAKYLLPFFPQSLSTYISYSPTWLNNENRISLSYPPTAKHPATSSIPLSAILTFPFYLSIHIRLSHQKKWWKCYLSHAINTSLLMFKSEFSSQMPGGREVDDSIVKRSREMLSLSNFIKCYIFSLRWVCALNEDERRRKKRW